MSKRGNTYPLLFNIVGQDLTDATEVILTLKPLNRPAILRESIGSFPDMTPAPVEEPGQADE